MSEPTKSPNIWNPVYAAHAIEQAAIVIGFDKPLDESAFSTASNRAKEKFPREDFPRQGVGLGPIMMPGIPMMPIMPIMGSNINHLGFQKFQTDGRIDVEIRMDRMGLVFRTLNYTRWAQVWGHARKFFEELLPIYASTLSIMTIGLQYTNKFIQTDPNQEAAHLLLLQKESPYISPHIYSTKDMWHNHIGAFENPDEKTKRLINVNLDYINDINADGEHRAMRIATTLTDSFNQPEYTATVAGPNEIQKLCDDHLNGLYLLNKEIIGKVISKEMAQRIGLWDA